MIPQTVPDLRSEEVKEVVGSPPPWIVRWGTGLFTALLVLLLVLAHLIRYPVIVKAPFRLTTPIAPKAVQARVDGRIVRLFVQEGSSVQPQAVLAYLESTAEHEQVLALERYLEKLARLPHESIGKDLPANSSLTFERLGELQSAYQTFATSLRELHACSPDGFYGTRQRILQQELTDLEALARNLSERLTISEQEYQLALEEYQVQQQLVEEKVIASLESKREESKLLAKRKLVKEAESAMLLNRTAQHQKRKELNELQQLVAQYRDVFRQSLFTLQSAIAAWKRQYVLIAPCAGQVRFATAIEENQPLRPGQAALFIAPDQKQYVGELRLPQYNLGKVKAGQQVLIKFAGYPFEEYGAVEGRITTIAQIPGNDSTFSAKVRLPTGFTTQYGKRVTYRVGMQANAEIITEDSSLLEKLVYLYRKAIRSQ